MPLMLVLVLLLVFRPLTFRFDWDVLARGACAAVNAWGADRSGWSAKLAYPHGFAVSAARPA
eukprot:8963890-Pyramimonas_sp.AAC.1